MRYADLADEHCSITRPLVVLGDRWTLVILKHAFAGVRRFNAFRDALGISRGQYDELLLRGKVAIEEQKNEIDKELSVADEAEVTPPPGRDPAP